MSEDAGGLSARVGELRRLTIMFCDVVGSTELSGRHEPETYRELMRGYRAACRDIIEDRFEGHIVQLKGDGTLSAFGFPVAHENDAERAVRAGLELVRAVHALATGTESLDVRVAVHHGPVFLDLDEDDIYGLAANVGARLHAVADPGTVVVSDEIRRLVDDRFEIAAGDPQLVKGVAEPLTPFRVVRERPMAARRDWSTPLVERDDELARLRRAWASVAAGTAHDTPRVLVRGDAGVGKSRLVTALADEVRAADARVVELHGSPFHADAGFHPVRRLVEARCDLDDDAGPAERLERLAGEVEALGLDPTQAVPLLAPVLGIDPSAGYAPTAAEGRRLEEQVRQAVLEYLLACAGGRPALVVAENLHWFDEATRGALAGLGGDSDGCPLVVATSREPQQGWETIELRPLTPAGRLALIDALDRGLSEEERRALASRSDGIPLFIEELVRASTDRPAAPRAPAPEPGSVPSVLYEPLVARLYATPAALPVVATAAAAGQEVDRSLLAAALAVPDEALDAPLAALLDARVLEAVEGRPGRLRFRHELLREVAYELQPPSWRRRVHDRLCDLLPQDDTSDWHVLAVHFERAERHGEAATAYGRTAESARRRGALEEARAHLTRAIELVVAHTADPGGRQEVRLRLRRGFLAMSAGGAAAVHGAADFERCLELASADPQSDAMVAASIALWTYYLSRAELDRARKLTTQFPAGLDGRRAFIRPQNRAGSGMLDWFAGDFARARGVLESAVDELTAMGDAGRVAAVWFVPNDPSVAMHAHLAVARFMAGDVAGADRSHDRAVEIAASLDFPQGPWSAAYATWLGSWMWIEADRLGAAALALEEARGSCAQHGFDGWELILSTQLAALAGAKALHEGSAGPTALSALADALGGHVEVWRMLEARVFLTFYLTAVGALRAAAGDGDEARRQYEASLGLAAETGMRFYDAETMRRLAHLSADAEPELRAALELARSQGARPFELRAALDLHAVSGDAGPLARALAPYPDGATTADLDEARLRLTGAR